MGCRQIARTAKPSPLSLLPLPVLVSRICSMENSLISRKMIGHRLCILLSASATSLTCQTRSICSLRSLARRMNDLCTFTIMSVASNTTSPLPCSLSLHHAIAVGANVKSLGVCALAFRVYVPSSPPAAVSETDPSACTRYQALRLCALCISRGVFDRHRLEPVEVYKKQQSSIGPPAERGEGR